jgi:DNA (cytosine-5)-methyltransferase 1
MKMRELTHLSLFTGIGGLDLASEWAGFTIVGQCEFADYSTMVLEKHWPAVPRWRDIRDLTADEFFRRTGKRNVTVVSGGFPCQPHSLAGMRKASGDERDLWPEYARIIREIGPDWVVAENVPGLLSSEHGRFFGKILIDLDTLGYDAAWGVWGACDVGALHERERVCIVAHANRLMGKAWDGLHKKHGRPIQGSNQEKRFYSLGEISEAYMCGNDDGIPARVDRLRCLGNAVVPQQFFPVFEAIAEVEA